MADLTRRVLCVGDLILDRFIECEVSRISREAPVPVAKYVHEVSMLGGAGNVARNIKALGGECGLIGAVGGDEDGGELRRLVGRANVKAKLALTQRTNVKTRYCASQQMLKVDRDCGCISDVRSQVQSMLAGYDAVILSDYGLGVLEYPGSILAMCRDRGIPTIVDPRGPAEKYRGATVLKPNRAELREMTGLPVQTVEDCMDAAMFLAKGCTVVATLAGDGMIVAEELHARHIPADAREVYDVSGAGDTVAAVLGMHDGPVYDAAVLANRAAGIVVGKRGTATVSMDELEVQ